MKPILKLIFLTVICISTSWAAEPLKIVSTLPDYASIARYLGRDRVEVESISKGYQDPHFVKAKPSFARKMAQAQLFLTTGLDLELWGPTLIDKSRNRKIREGQPGYVSVSHGVHLLDVPRNANRSLGDIHIYGNPHIHADPLRGLQIAANILVGLKKVDREGAGFYEENFEAFRQETYRRLYGAELVEIVGGMQLERLARGHQFDRFLDSNQFDGRSLRSYLGGWLKLAECLRGKEIVAYHKNWIYFTDRFGIRIADYVEDKPGIPPSARHVVELIGKIQSRKIRVLWAANYFDESAPSKIEEKAGAKAFIVPLSVGGTPQAKDYFDLFDIWLGALRSAYPDCR